MNYILMLVAYAMIIGVALLFYELLNTSGFESLILSIITMVLSMYLGGFFEKFTIGVIITAVIAMAGIIVYIWKLIVNRHQFLRYVFDFFSPAVCAVSVLFVVQIVLFRRDYIQNIDDLHQWAASVKYMLNNGTFPQDDFIGNANLPLFTSLFNLFFQKISGYHEGNMYAASFLFVWVGMLMPFARSDWKKSGRILVYMVFMYIALYSLYAYPYRCMYVDMPLATWSAGFCGYFVGMKRDEQNTNKINQIIFIVGIMLVISQIKWAVGLLFVAFSVFYMIMSYIGIQGFSAFGRKLWDFKIAILAFVGVGIAGLTAWVKLANYRVIPGNGAATIEALTLSSEKAKLTFANLLKNIVAKKLGGNSSITITSVEVLAVVTIILILAVFFVKKTCRREMIVDIIYLYVCFIGYTMILYITYVSTFSYDESVSNASVSRYLAIYMVYTVILTAVLIIREDTQWRINRLIPLFGMIILTLFFATGINEKFIARATSFAPEGNGKYEYIQRAKRGVEYIQNKMSAKDKVYMLVQGSSLEKKNEYPMAVPLYYDSKHIGNYIRTPWKFVEGGSIIGSKRTDLEIYAFKDLLTQGGYTYVWVYSKDKYLSTKFNELFGLKSLKKGGLYKVKYVDGQAESLKLVKTLK